MRRLSLFALLLPAMAAGSLLAQTHPNLERGLNAGKAYQVGEIDSVSLFNGNLSVAIPLGQAYRLSEALSYSFVLRYNSNIWDHRLETFTDDCDGSNRSITVTQSYAMEQRSGLSGGPGWSLDFGTLKQSGWGQTLDQWTYVSPDGSTHPFYPTLHDGETARAGYRYTRDGTYMRLVADNYSTGEFCPGGWLGATVEFADGRRQTFWRQDTCQVFTLTGETDRFGNTISYTWDWETDRWVITDSWNRTHYVGLKWEAYGTFHVIDYVDLQSFGGARAVYSFTYASRSIARSCKHYYDPSWRFCDPQLPPTVTVPFLTAIEQPDGTRWTMLNGTEPGYNLDGEEACGTIPQDRPGTLTHLKAPTGGTWNWTYATWSNPVGGTSCYSEPAEISHVKDATGVHDRTLTDPFGASSTGLWQYRHDTWRLGDGSVDPDSQESWTTVTTPEGDESRSWFRTKYCGAPQEGWDYGLPYTKGRTGNLAEPWVSSRQYDGSAAVPSNLRRTSSLRYAKDTLNAAWEPARLQQSNRRVEFEKTVFEDDPIAGGGGNHYATVERADFDGLGHYRIVMNGGSFGSLRHTTTAYNLGYSYPPATPPAEWWPYTSPWVIGTYPWTRAEEAGVSARTEACFDAATGYLQRTRTLKASGTSGTDPAPSSADVVVRRTQTGGSTTREEWFGGDTQSVGTGSLCSLTLPATPAYRMDHAYQYGSLRSSRWVGSNGVPLSYYVVDRDLDASTGLVVTSRDTAGLATDYAYDTMGRPTWEMPRTAPVNGGSWVQSCYVPASPPSTPARVDLYWWPNGVIQPCLTYSGYLKRETVDVDGFGRPWREYRKLFDGSWGQRLTTYNGLGWTTSASEWQQYPVSLVKKTEYLGYDPFGRPATIRPPDGATHDVTLTYTGVRLTSRTEKVATSTGVESPSTTTEERDVHGRLVKVTEPSDPGGTNVSTTYTYDVGGRLKQASTTSGPVTQSRTFTFDNRGFLLTEQLPEVGASGNGNVTYSKYDARGHARRIHDGAHDLAYSYDAGERLTQVSQANVLGNPGTPVVRAFSYATANGTGDYCNGKLQTATAHNPELASASVVETYTWGGVGGRVSARRTVVEGRTIDQAFSYTDLGHMSALGYPDDTGLAGVFDPARTVTHGYGLGFLTSVSPHLPTITYHPNGTVSEVYRSNGMKDVHLKDPNDVPRARQIYVQRVSDGNVYGGWGPWNYDGAGNVKTQGSDVFWYDLVSRLTYGTTTSGTNLQCATYNAFGTMTGLGTGTTGCTASPIAVNTATNRLSSPVTYDSAGNVTAWGGNTYSWNRQNQMYSTTGTGINRNYLYSADGERVAERNNQDGTRTIRIRDLSGKVLREYGRTSLGVWNWSKDYVYRDGILAATETSSETRHYHHDHLGSVRGATDMQSPPGIYWDTVRDYYPFGLDAFSKPDPERMRFTGHERDTQGTLSQTDDLDYMHARHYSPVVGRFLSIDPGRDWNASEPQSWNLYAYARNNPTTFIDPTGLMSEDGRVIAEAGVTAADPAAEEARAAEAARRAQLALQMMRLRSSSQSSASSFGQRLLGAFTNNQLPAMYQARADKACAEADYIPCAIDLFGARVLPRNFLGPEGVLLIGSLFLPAARLAEGPAIVFGHGGRHLLGTAISEAAAEQAIRAQIADQVGRATLSGSFWGRVSIGGTTLTYRAYTLPNGTINVGTYYP